MIHVSGRTNDESRLQIEKRRFCEMSEDRVFFVLVIILVQSARDSMSYYVVSLAPHLRISLRLCPRMHCVRVSSLRPGAKAKQCNYEMYILRWRCLALAAARSLSSPQSAVHCERTLYITFQSSDGRISGAKRCAYWARRKDHSISLV